MDIYLIIVIALFIIALIVFPFIYPKMSFALKCKIKIAMFSIGIPLIWIGSASGIFSNIAFTGLFIFLIIKFYKDLKNDQEEQRMEEETY